MRVLMLGWFGSAAESGGMEVHIREICKNFAPEIQIILAVPKAAKNLPAGKNIEIIEVPCKTRAKTIGGVIRNVAIFNKNMEQIIASRSNAFDIIHSHDWLCVEAAKKMSEKYKVLWIHTVHSLEHIRAAEETNSMISKIEKSGISGADRIITVSNLMKKEILKKYDVSAAKILVIRNSASMPRADESRKINSDNREKTVLFAGRLALQKGIETLISAFPEVLKKHRDAKLTIAGSGNLKKSLLALAKINGIEKSVSFAGHVSENELRQLYMKASVFVSPSVFEPFGITLLDAAEFGAPIIATKYTGALEIFEKGNVSVVEPLEKHALAEEIIALLDSKKTGAAMAAGAKLNAEAAGGWKEIAGETKKAYSGVLESKL